MAVIGIANAEKLSRQYVAIINTNGHWEYQSLSVRDTEAWVVIVDSVTGYRHKHTWTLSKQEKLASTVRVRDFKDNYKITHTHSNDISSVVEIHFISNFSNFVVQGDVVSVSYYGRDNGTGYCFQLLMKDGLDERTCVETFLNYEVKAIQSSNKAANNALDALNSLD